MGEKEKKNIGMPNNGRKREKKNIAMEILSHFQITNLFIAGGHLSLDLSLCIMQMNLRFLYDEFGATTTSILASLTKYFKEI